MKLTVVNCDGGLGLGLLPGLALAVHRDLVVDAKLALWHPRQVRLHEDLTGDMSGQHLEEIVLFMNGFSSSKCQFTDLTLGRHEKVDILNHVEEKLVPPVLDTLPPPANLASDLEILGSEKICGEFFFHLASDSRLFLFGGGLDALLGDEGLENPSV